MKKIKDFFHFVFVYQPLNKVQAHATRWQIFRFWCRNGARRALMVSTFAVVAGVVAISYRTLHPRTVYAEKEILTDSLGLKISDLKGELLGRLMACESQGLNEDDGIIVFDTNNKASIGVFQFQKKTVIHYYKTLYGKDITAKEAVEIALDRELSTELASDIIFKTDKGLSNWFNCTQKLGLESEARFIKRLNN